MNAVSASVRFRFFFGFLGLFVRTYVAAGQVSWETSKGRFTLPVFTARQHGCRFVHNCPKCRRTVFDNDVILFYTCRTPGIAPTRPVNTAVQNDTRVHGPCSRVDGPWTRVVCTKSKPINLFSQTEPSYIEFNRFEMWDWMLLAPCAAHCSFTQHSFTVDWVWGAARKLTASPQGGDAVYTCTEDSRLCRYASVQRVFHRVRPFPRERCRWCRRNLPRWRPSCTWRVHSPTPRLVGPPPAPTIDRQSASQPQQHRRFHRQQILHLHSVIATKMSFTEINFAYDWMHTFCSLSIWLHAANVCYMRLLMKQVNSVDNDVIHDCQLDSHFLYVRLWRSAKFDSKAVNCKSSLYYYFARGRGCEVLWWVCLSVCLSVREDISGTTRAIFTNFCGCCLCPWLGPPPACWR